MNCHNRDKRTLKCTSETFWVSYVGFQKHRNHFIPPERTKSLTSSPAVNLQTQGSNQRATPSEPPGYESTKHQTHGCGAGLRKGKGRSSGSGQVRAAWCSTSAKATGQRCCWDHNAGRRFLAETRLGAGKAVGKGGTARTSCPDPRGSWQHGQASGSRRGPRLLHQVQVHMVPTWRPQGTISSALESEENYFPVPGKKSPVGLPRK